MIILRYIHVCLFFFQSFGPETNAIITLNLPKGYGLDFSMVVKSCLCLALFFTYPGEWSHQLSFLSILSILVSAVYRGWPLLAV